MREKEKAIQSDPQEDDIQARERAAEKEKMWGKAWNAFSICMLSYVYAERDIFHT